MLRAFTSTNIEMRIKLNRTYADIINADIKSKICIFYSKAYGRMKKILILGICFPLHGTKVGIAGDTATQ